MLNILSILFISIILPNFGFLLILFSRANWWLKKDDWEYINIKIRSKESILSNSIKLPKDIFNKFSIFLRRERNYCAFLIAYIIFILLVDLGLGISYYFIDLKTNKITDSLVLFALIGFPILAIIAIIETTFDLLKINKNKKIIDDWVIQNEKLPQWNKQIEKPLNYEQLKNIILYEDFELKIPIFKKSKIHFYTKKIKSTNKDFIKDNKIDIPKLLYFLLFDYDSGIQINNVTYSKEYFLYFIGEFLDNDFSRQ
ncbi:Hypothetical protein MALK_5090 [Metamycoplasma alkalescens 14918]|uniref:Transmembrane protein n=1 Tax=Metamycoplasma alkalescens 14918 TaxID=1188234 RepID=N9SQM8_9BACT|nr:hypothetical protein [Metamycoplasma alkalescens]ENY53760.1 Hypothetical protein MALK_5090 [Metamycoplasma alkalescens 14918]